MVTLMTNARQRVLEHKTRVAPLKKAMTPIGAGPVWSIVSRTIYMLFNEYWTNGDGK